MPGMEPTRPMRAIQRASSGPGSGPPAPPRRLCVPPAETQWRRGHSAARARGARAQSASARATGQPFVRAPRARRPKINPPIFERTRPFGSRVGSAPNSKLQHPLTSRARGRGGGGRGGQRVAKGKFFTVCVCVCVCVCVLGRGGGWGQTATKGKVGTVCVYVCVWGRGTDGDEGEVIHCVCVCWDRGAGDRRRRRGSRGGGAAARRRGPPRPWSAPRPSPPAR